MSPRPPEHASPCSGDVSMARNDPRSVRRAGRSYLAGLAYAHGAAFHPKLMVLAGPEHATIALGSGNTTLAGWQANAELWTVLRVDSEQSPTAVPELSAWLRDLPEKVRFSAGVPQALGAGRSTTGPAPPRQDTHGATGPHRQQPAFADHRSAAAGARRRTGRVRALLRPALHRTAATARTLPSEPVRPRLPARTQ